MVRPRHRGDRRRRRCRARASAAVRTRRRRRCRRCRACGSGSGCRSPAQRLDQLLGGVRLAEAGHVLDGQDVRAQLLQLLGQLDVVLRGRTWCASGRGCRRCSRWPPRSSAPDSQDGVHRDAHVRHPVERVEDAEEVDAACAAWRHEVADDVVGVVGVADGVGGPQQHLEQDVGDAAARSSASRSQGSSLQEPHRRVERGAAPHLEREQPAAGCGRSTAASAACRGCAPGWPGATGGRRGRWCR